MPHLEITEVFLVNSNIVNNYYQQDSNVLYKSISNKSFAQELDIFHKNYIFIKNINLEFSYIEIWFTGENSKPL